MNVTIHFKDYTILIVDDDVYIIELIRLYLANKGFQVLTAMNGEEGLRVLQEKNVHVLILDVMMPNMNGWEVCKRVREKSDLPILMLTAKGESADKLQGFDLGTDDYMVKPFDPNELVARVVSMVRRTYASSSRLAGLKPSHLQFDSLKIDLAGHTVMVRDEFVDLTPREYQLLLTFAHHPNQVLDRQQLLNLVWGEDYEGEDRVVDVFIKRLRKKLYDQQEKWAIETVRGTGYKLKVGK